MDGIPPISDTSYSPNSRSSLTAVASRIIFPIVILFVFLMYIFLPPASFPTRAILKVPIGSTLSSISNDAKELHMVRSQVVLQAFVVLFGDERGIKAGDYYFDQPMNVIRIAKMLAIGDFNLTPIKVTLPEGFTLRNIAKITDTLLPHFNVNEFLILTDGKEGYLFPDTYFMSPETTTEEFVRRLTDTYEQKIIPLRLALADLNKTEIDIINMASIIEREASGNDDRAIISGILWKRLEGGMRLQVDGPFMYMTGKNTVSSTDRLVDSPYNTYMYKGLPPTPIGNPGLASITASIYPKESPYLFYLHDNKGEVHYAKTFDEHKQNIKKYLK